MSHERDLLQHLRRRGRPTLDSTVAEGGVVAFQRNFEIGVVVKAVSLLVEQSPLSLHHPRHTQRKSAFVTRMRRQGLFA